MKNKIEIIIIGLITTLISIGISVALFVAAVAVYDYNLKQNYIITPKITQIQASTIDLITVEKVNKKEVNNVYHYDWVFITSLTLEHINGLEFNVVDKEWEIDVEKLGDSQYGSLEIIIKDVPVGKGFSFNIKKEYAILNPSWTKFDNTNEEYVKPVPIIETKTEYKENIGLIVGISILGITTILGIGYIVYDSVFYTENLIKDTIKKIKGKK